jgi:hypothetical protein
LYFSLSKHKHWLYLQSTINTEKGTTVYLVERTYLRNLPLGHSHSRYFKRPLLFNSIFWRFLRYVLSTRYTVVPFSVLMVLCRYNQCLCLLNEKYNINGKKNNSSFIFPINFIDIFNITFRVVLQNWIFWWEKGGQWKCRHYFYYIFDWKEEEQETVLLKDLFYSTVFSTIVV